MPLNPEYFPPLNIPALGGEVRPDTVIVIWADAQKAFAGQRSEIPAGAPTSMEMSQPSEENSQNHSSWYALLFDDEE